MRPKVCIRCGKSRRVSESGNLVTCLIERSVCLPKPFTPENETDSGDGVSEPEYGPEPEEGNDLETFMLNQGLRSLEITQNGNSWIVACLHQMNLDPSLHQEVRRQLCDWMEVNSSSLEYFYSRTDTGEHSLQERIELMRDDGMIGENVEFLALSAIFHREILVYETAHQDPVSFKHPSAQHSEKPALIVSRHHCGFHFKPVVPLGRHDSEDIDQTVRLTLTLRISVLYPYYKLTECSLYRMMFCLNVPHFAKSPLPKSLHVKHWRGTLDLQGTSSLQLTPLEGLVRGSRDGWS